MKDNKSDSIFWLFVVFISYILMITEASAKPYNSEQNNVFSDLSQKEIYTKGYPLYFKFRGEYVTADHTNYATWVNSLNGTTGLMQKFTKEELDVPSTYQKWVNQYATEHPEKLLLLHWNGQARQVETLKSVRSLYFPGHWVYEVGSQLLANALPTDTLLSVSSVSPFSLTAYKNNTITPAVGYPSYILLVPTDNLGNRLWYQSEVVRLKQIYASENKISVSRAMVFSTSKIFEANKTYALSISGTYLDSHIMWYYNLSSTCPLDSTGKNAGDILSDELAGLFKTTGVLKNMNGIAFDVNYFDSSSHSTWDVNNDGIADGGWVNSRNVWRDGDYDFLKKVRSKLGNNYIITSDCEFDTNQQAVGVMNGIESEGLVQYNDGWRGFSRAINTHSYWTNNTNLTYPFRYVALKLMNSNDILNQPRLLRFATATACCMKAFLANLPDSTIFPSWMKTTPALGMPNGELIHCAKSSTNLQTLTNDLLMTKLTSSDCTLSLSDGNILVTSKWGYKASQTMKLSLSNLTLPAGDITVFVEAQSIDTLVGIPRSEFVPRAFYTSLSGLPDYGEGKTVNSYYSDLYGLFGTNKPEEMSFYFRRPGVTQGSHTLSLEIQERGSFIIKSIKIYNQPDVLMRSFDNGLVVVNPSLDSVSVNLINWFSDKEVTAQPFVVPPVDALFVHALNKITTVGLVISSPITTIIHISDHAFLLRNAEAIGGHLSIYGISGNSIQTILVGNSETCFTLPVRGVYFWLLKNKNGILSKGKIVY